MDDHDFADDIVVIDGSPYKVKDIPSTELRAFFGYGHQSWSVKNRRILPGEWPYTPDTCRTDRWCGEGVWVDDPEMKGSIDELTGEPSSGQSLACKGCGMDFT